MKHLALIACGGTIAGRASSPVNTSDYRAGEASIEALAAAVPGLTGIASFSMRQLFSIDSADLDEAHLLALARAVREAADSPSIDGIVVTHGTDTMEESAYFLNLTVHTRKPVVLTGAMRPSTALSADGPRNLLEAAALAASPESEGRGVMILFNDRIIAARFGEKVNATNTDAFRGREEGFMGLMDHEKPVFYQAPLRIHTMDSRFSVPAGTSLPPVRILYAYAGMDGRMVSEAVEDGAAGLVMAGLGYGNIPSYIHEETEDALKKGVYIVRTSRTLGGRINRHPGDDPLLIAGDTLTPQKAKLLLQLSLLENLSPEEVQEAFFRY